MTLPRHQDGERPRHGELTHKILIPASRQQMSIAIRHNEYATELF